MPEEASTAPVRQRLAAKYGWPLPRMAGGAPEPGEPGGPESQETPVTETSETPETPEQTQPDTDWQKRYTDLQPEYTRATQEAAQYRQAVEALSSDDPELRAQAAEFLGVEFDEPEQEPLDEYDELKRELQELKSWRDQETQARQTASQREAEIEYMDQQFDSLERSEKRDFTDKEVEAVAKLAQQTRDDEGRPDVDGAYKFLLEYVDEATPRRVASKKAAQVQTGRAGEKKFDFHNKEERANRMAAVIEAHS